MSAQAAEVMSRLTAAGLRLEARGEAIHASPRANLTDASRAPIRRHKRALLSLLTSLPCPLPDPSPADPEAILEAIDERAAMRAYRVLVAMGQGEPDRWLVMIAPGCDLAEASAAARLAFGPDRVRDAVAISGP
jgi:hypothetical protein